MHKADGDLMENTRWTNQSKEADKLQHLATDGNEREACEDACRKPNEEQMEQEIKDCWMDKLPNAYW